MSVYASCDGEIITKPMNQNDVHAFLQAVGSQPVCKHLNACWDVPDCFANFDVEVIDEDSVSAVQNEVKVITAEKVAYRIAIYGFDKYHDDEVTDFLLAIAPFVTKGELKYDGEESHWRFHFRDGEWYEDEGIVTFINSTAPLSPKH